MELNIERYKFLDLSYMKEVSRGDTDYERIVMQLFVQMIPKNIETLKLDMELNNLKNLKRVLIHLQKSNLIVGLDEILFDFEPFDQNHLLKLKKENIDLIALICNNALEDAKRYLKTLN